MMGVGSYVKKRGTFAAIMANSPGARFKPPRLALCLFDGLPRMYISICQVVEIITAVP
jgi:hypothetical protein